MRVTGKRSLLPPLGLVPRLIAAAAAGILIGSYADESLCRAIVTASGLFSSFLKFIIPLMILGLVTGGIASLSSGSGLLLFLTVAISYLSSIVAGSYSYAIASMVFPSFMEPSALAQIASAAGRSLSPYFSVAIPPVFDTLSALVLAFMLGIGISVLRGGGGGKSLYGGISDLGAIVEMTLQHAVIPLLPLYICGTFVDMTWSGKTFAIMGILWKVFIVVIIMHLTYIAAQFFIAGAISGKSPIRMILNQIPGYATAIGTQSSAATIPVNMKCAEADGISPEIRGLVVPLCANIHLSGSMITLVATGIAICMMNDIPIGLHTVLPFILVLGVAMVAAPGAPGGGVMTALPFLHLLFGSELGDPNGPLCATMIALYITQDSFGTACNVSGDNAIGLIVDTIYKKKIA